MQAEENRDVPLYARVKKTSVAYFKAEAKKTNMSLSKYMDKLADTMRG